jgi:hypothetical protein
MEVAQSDEDARARRLMEAQDKAVELFTEIERRGLVRPGALESAVSDEVRDLGAELFGTYKHWHKRVVRSGPNTLQPYRENPPDRAIEADDIVFLDFGPIFSEWEADFGRTFVLGDDPVKHRLRDDLPRIFEEGRRHFDAQPRATGDHRSRALRPHDRAGGGRGLGVRRTPRGASGGRVPARTGRW